MTKRDEKAFAQPMPSAKVRYFDAHAHLQDEWLAPHLSAACDALERLPVEQVVVNGTCEGDWAGVSELTQRYSWVRPSFGLHPWLVGNCSSNWANELIRRLEEHPTAGVGEIGLDRWILENARPDDPRLAGLRRASLDEQRSAFVLQLQLAAEKNLPATIHCLEAWGALHQILSTERLPARGFLLHAYGGPPEMLADFVRRGAYFSFNGYFLDPRKERQQRAFKEIPMDRLLIETDAPSMPLPQAWRTYKLPPGPAGMAINHPANIEATYTGLAALRGIAVAELAQTVEVNFRRFFGPSR
jgi:TatD DNase family protein